MYGAGDDFWGLVEEDVSKSETDGARLNGGCMQREAAAWEAGQRWQRDDMARRKSRLEAGFAEVCHLVPHASHLDCHTASAHPCSQLKAPWGLLRSQ